MRRVIITKSYNFVAPEELTKHPLLNKCWQLPREYTLIEILDPVLRQEEPLCQTSRHAALASMAEGMLFAPFHRRMKSLADITTLHFSAQTTSYYLITESRYIPRWPSFVFSPHWDAQEAIAIHCRLNSDLISRFEVLQSSFVEWAARMREIGKLRLFLPVVSERRKYVVNCEFDEPCGDQIITLFMLLADTGLQTCLRSVSFYLPGARIRGSRNTSQLPAPPIAQADGTPNLKEPAPVSPATLAPAESNGHQERNAS